MPCIPIAKLSGPKSFSPISSESDSTSPSSSSSSSSDSSMASNSYKHGTVGVLGSNSVYSDDIIQAQKAEERRQHIDADNRPQRPGTPVPGLPNSLPRERLLHCPGCNMYLDGRPMLRCNKGSCPNVWYRYGKLQPQDEHPVLMEVWDKQANHEWIVRRTFNTGK